MGCNPEKRRFLVPNGTHKIIENRNGFRFFFAHPEKRTVFRIDGNGCFSGGHEEVLRAAAWGEARSLRELLKMEHLPMLEDRGRGGWVVWLVSKMWIYVHQKYLGMIDDPFLTKIRSLKNWVEIRCSRSRLPDEPLIQSMESSRTLIKRECRLPFCQVFTF